MPEDLTPRADRILEEALAATGARDPREFYRERLRALKQSNSEGYNEAVEYYRDSLIPSVAGGKVDPLDAWTEYGRTLAIALAPGRTVSIDDTGLAHPYDGPSRDRLILQLPDDGARALLIGLPSELSSAQRAAYDVLVAGKHQSRD